MAPKSASDPGVERSRFSTTRWSLIFSSAKGGSANEQAARAALNQLCRIYWRPIFAFLCGRGFSTADAQDLTQDFFVMVFEGRVLAGADPERGRFRSLVLRALQNFLHDSHDRKITEKRGGNLEFVPWDDWMAEAPSNLTVPAHMLDAWTPERIFDVRWAATVVERALGRLREECEARGRGRVFDLVSGALSSERADVSYPDLSAALGVPDAAVKQLLHQLRKRYRALLREEVALTVEKEADVEDEIRYLCAALAAAPS